MDNIELEEGEAFSYNSDGCVDFDASMDPDIALSYIDEKLEHVLGHLQKDFEGGVSAEHLGSKFGGYGSFLPTYQRSPVFYHPATSPKYQQLSEPPNNLQVEGGYRNSVTSSTGSQSIRLEPASTGSSLPAAKASSSVADSIRQEICISSTDLADGISSGHGAMNKKLKNSSDPNLLKVRIKVGLDNLSTQKKTEIYSGLGLDFSPSSLDGSPLKTEQMLCEPEDGLSESPMHILKMMISFPLPCLLLSPLPDGLLQLTHNEKLPEGGGSLSFPRSGPENVGVLANGTNFKDNQKVKREKKTRSVKRNEISDETESDKQKDNQSGTNVSTKEELDFDTMTPEELVSNTLKLPLLKAIDSVSIASNRVSVEKHTYNEVEDKKLPPKKEKKKRKGSHSHGNASAEVSKEGIRVASSSLSKNGSNGYADDHRKTNPEASDRYKEFFGDMNVEQEGNLISPTEMRCEDKGKDCAVVEKSTGAAENALEERPSGIKSDKQSTSGANPTASGVAPISRNLPIPDAAPTSMPVVIDEYWVGCEKCEKWRLLPHGTKPRDLPEKWVCSMLSWLPGMNRCSISEEETTKALISSYQVPPADNLQTNHPGTSHITTFDAQQLNHNHQRFGSHVRKKHSSKKLSTAKSSGPTQLLNPQKKTMKTSVLNRNSNDVNLSVASMESDFLRVTNSSDLMVEEHGYMQREKYNAFERVSDGGDTKRSNMIDNRELDQDCLRGLKKIKTEGFPGDLASNHDVDKVSPSSSNNLSRKKLPGYDNHTSKDSHYDRKDGMCLSTGKTYNEARVLWDDGSKDSGKHDNRYGAKKRKSKESHVAQASSDTRKHHQDSRISIKDERDKDEYRNDKKARLFRSDGKGSSANKASDRTKNRGSHRKNELTHMERNPGSIGSQRSLDGVDSLKRESGSFPASVAATSSSSKVSGSHKMKADIHDIKGSPVESVSSSPMRASRPEKSPPIKGKIAERVDFNDAGIFNLKGERGYPEVENIGEALNSGTARKEKAPDMVCNGSQDKNSIHVSDVKANAIIDSSASIMNPQFKFDGADDLGQHTQYPHKTTSSYQCLDDKKQNNHHLVHGSEPKKSGKVLPLSSKNKDSNSISELNNNSIKVHDSVDGQVPSYIVKPMDGIDATEGWFAVKTDEDVTNNVYDKYSLRPLLNVTRKAGNQPGRSSSPDIKLDGSHNPASNSEHILLPDCKTFSGGGKSLSLPPSAESQYDKLAKCHQLVPEFNKGSVSNMLGADASDGDNSSKALKQIKRVAHPTGAHPNGLRSSSNGHRIRDFDASNQAKRDLSSQAATNALKEAKSLKHMADRVKSSGSSLEGTRLYFEAALKFLHGAAIMETCSSENTKSGEMTQSVTIYSSTAALCKYCAHEYERSKDMAAAALAYKCMEVAYLRVINFANTTANGDRHELQVALQMIPPGESPSSSASDVDNANHPTADKVSLAKGITSPQVTGSHFIAARNRPCFSRVLNFVQDVNSAMEASRKSRLAYAAANESLGEGECRDGLLPIKTALDFNYQDVEGFLRLVRLAFDVISR